MISVSFPRARPLPTKPARLALFTHFLMLSRGPGGGGWEKCLGRLWMGPSYKGTAKNKTRKNYVPMPITEIGQSSRVGQSLFAPPPPSPYPTPSFVASFSSSLSLFLPPFISLFGRATDPGMGKRGCREKATWGPGDVHGCSRKRKQTKKTKEREMIYVPNQRGRR